MNFWFSFILGQVTTIARGLLEAKIVKFSKTDLDKIASCRNALNEILNFHSTEE